VPMGTMDKWKELIKDTFSALNKAEH
jgi:hypothetical protein